MNHAITLRLRLGYSDPNRTKKSSRNRPSAQPGKSTLLSALSSQSAPLSPLDMYRSAWDNNLAQPGHLVFEVVAAKGLSTEKPTELFVRPVLRPV